MIIDVIYEISAVIKTREAVGISGTQYGLLERSLECRITKDNEITGLITETVPDLML